MAHGRPDGYEETKGENTQPAGAGSSSRLAKVVSQNNIESISIDTAYARGDFNTSLLNYKGSGYITSFKDQLTKLKTLLKKYYEQNTKEKNRLFPLSFGKLIKLQRLKSLNEVYAFFNDVIQHPDKFIKENYENRAENYDFSFVTKAIEKRALNPDLSKSRSEILIGLMYEFLRFYSNILQLRGTAPENVCKASDLPQVTQRALLMNFKNQFDSEVKGLLSNCINSLKILITKQQAKQINTDNISDLQKGIVEIITDTNFELTSEKIAFSVELLRFIQQNNEPDESDESELSIKNQLILRCIEALNKSKCWYIEDDLIGLLEKLYVLIENFKPLQNGSRLSITDSQIEQFEKTLKNLNPMSQVPVHGHEAKLKKLVLCLKIYNQHSLKMGEAFAQWYFDAYRCFDQFIVAHNIDIPFEIRVDVFSHGSFKRSSPLFEELMFRLVNEIEVDRIRSNCQSLVLKQSFRGAKRVVTTEKIKEQLSRFALNSVNILTELGGDKVLVDAFIHSLINLSNDVENELHSLAMDSSNLNFAMELHYKANDYASFINFCVENLDEKLLKLADNHLLAQLAYILFKHDCPILFNKVLNAGASILGSLEEYSPSFYDWGRPPSLFDKVTSEQPYSTYNSTLIWNHWPLESVVYIKKCIKKLYKSGYSVPDLITKLLDKNTLKGVEYLFSLLSQTEKKSIFQNAVITTRLIKLHSPRISLDWFLNLSEENRLALFQNGELLNIALKSKSPEMLDYCLNKMNDDEVHAFVNKDETQTELRKIFTESGNFYMQMYCYCTGELMLGQELGHLPDKEMGKICKKDDFKELKPLKQAMVLNMHLNPAFKSARHALLKTKKIKSLIKSLTLIEQAEVFSLLIHPLNKEFIHEIKMVLGRIKLIALAQDKAIIMKNHAILIAENYCYKARSCLQNISAKAFHVVVSLLNKKVRALEKVEGPLKRRLEAPTRGVDESVEKPVSAAAFAAASAGAPAGSAHEAKGIDG